MGGAGCVGWGAGGNSFLNDLRAFGINADQWTLQSSTRSNGARRRNKGQNVFPW